MKTGKLYDFSVILNTLLDPAISTVFFFTLLFTYMSLKLVRKNILLYKFSVSLLSRQSAGEAWPVLYR